MTNAEKAYITGGSVTFEQSRKLAEYENRKASVTLNVGDGVDAPLVVDQALGLASAYVWKALGLTVSQTPATTVAASDAAPAAGKNKGGRPPKTPAATPPPAGDPAGFGDAAAPSTQKTLVEIHADNKKPKDPADLSDFENLAPPTITDEALGSAISKKNKTFVDANNAAGTELIKNLIRRAGATRYAEITQVLRDQFLKDLDALK